MLPVLLLAIALFLTGGEASADAAGERTPATASGTADASPMAGELVAALGLDETIEAMHAEGLAYGDRIEVDLFPEAGGARWRKLVGKIYDTGRMRELLLDTLDREVARIEPDQLAQAHGFFTSPLGGRIVQLENSARLAQLDEDVQAQSRAEAEMLRVENPAREALIERFIAANDLIEANVVGALNANTAFYFGLGEGGAFPQPMSEEEVLADVWSQEQGIRDETGDWVRAYLALAYRPLGDDELERYIAFSASPAGRALNRALFAAYDAMFVAISNELGREAARFVGGSEL